MAIPIYTVQKHVQTNTWDVQQGTIIKEQGDNKVGTASEWGQVFDIHPFALFHLNLFQFGVPPNCALSSWKDKRNAFTSIPFASMPFYTNFTI